MMARARSLIALALFGSTACYDEDPFLSSDVATGDIDLYVVATGEPEATRMTIDVLGPAGRVELVGGDRLFARAPGAPAQPLEPKALVHEAVLPAEVVAIDVDLVREAPYEGSSFRVELPARTSLVVPAAASRSEPLRIEWTPGPGSYTSIIRIVGDCFTEVLQDAPVDPGFYIVKPADLVPSSGTCPVTITLTRTLSTNVPAPAVGRVDAVLTQVMTATFESVP